MSWFKKKPVEVEEKPDVADVQHMPFGWSAIVEIKSIEHEGLGKHWGFDEDDVYSLGFTATLYYLDEERVEFDSAILEIKSRVEAAILSRILERVIPLDKEQDLEEYLGGELVFDDCDSVYYINDRPVKVY